MNYIITPIKADDKEAISNLQAPLFFLLNKSVYKTYDAPNSPSEEELKDLKAKLQEEQQISFYGEATKQLVFIFQIQQGLGDNFKGEVDEKTAAKLNDVLKGLGAFEEEVKSQVEKKLEFFKFNFALDDTNQQQLFNQVYVEKAGKLSSVAIGIGYSVNLFR